MLANHAGLENLFLEAGFPTETGRFWKPGLPVPDECDAPIKLRVAVGSHRR